MFRALTCPFSGGKIIFTQGLLSLLSLNVCTVHWLRAVGWWNNSILWCTFEKTSNYIRQNKQNRFTNIRTQKQNCTRTTQIWYNKTCRARQITPTYANIKMKGTNSRCQESALKQCTVQTITESEDTRCSVNTIFPPEDGHVNARNMSRIIV